MLLAVSNQLTFGKGKACFAFAERELISPLRGGEVPYLI